MRCVTTPGSSVNLHGRQGGTIHHKLPELHKNRLRPLLLASFYRLLHTETTLLCLYYSTFYNLTGKCTCAVLQVLLPACHLGARVPCAAMWWPLCAELLPDHFRFQGALGRRRFACITRLIGWLALLGAARCCTFQAFTFICYRKHKKKNCITIGSIKCIRHALKRTNFGRGTVRLSNTLSINKHGSYILIYICVAKFDSNIMMGS